ncbi:hypothetical protein AMECASPLE_038653 [Ameca splendens]|uniref:Uncharacterized protein n=1 Tax=Ameca splendens TaxID=208324 RepID=A0ABV0Y851_9TELE
MCKSQIIKMLFYLSLSKNIFHSDLFHTGVHRDRRRTKRANVFCWQKDINSSNWIQECHKITRSYAQLNPAEANGVREKPRQRRGLPAWKEDSRDRIIVLTRAVSGQDGPPSYSSGANP